jgi:EAL domain-containing protein (putative c-di-GMP-specific phosphodiesterase class I)
VLSELLGMGIQIELDEFGTGYSSLNSLRKLPLTTIKLDRSLIGGITTGDSRGVAIVRAALAMAKAMGMQIIAEGVELPEQRDFLVQEGCDLMQGYLFGKPMPFACFVEYLRAHRFSPAGATPLGISEHTVLPALTISDFAGEGLRVDA